MRRATHLFASALPTGVWFDPLARARSVRLHGLRVPVRRRTRELESYPTAQRHFTPTPGTKRACIPPLGRTIYLVPSRMTFTFTLSRMLHSPRRMDVCESCVSTVRGRRIHSRSCCRTIHGTPTLRLGTTGRATGSRATLRRTRTQAVHAHGETPYSCSPYSTLHL